MQKRTLLLALVVALLFTVVPAMGDSFLMTGSLSFESQFDTLQLFIETPEVDFMYPGMYDINADDGSATWIAGNINPQYVLASGVATNNIDVLLWFASNPSTPFSMDVYVSAGSVLISSFGVNYGVNDEGDYGFSDAVDLIHSGGLADENTSPTPEPFSFALLGGGLGVLGLVRRRRG